MMRDKRNSVSVDLIKLLKKIDNFDESLICVFEGEDAKYYGIRIDGVISHLERKNLSCKGKKNVITLRDKVKKNPELSNAKILYFIDMDFDNHIIDSDLYCTPCYSIENFYVRSDVFKKILTDELGLCSFKDDDLIVGLCSEYEAFENLADEALVDLNGWLMLRIKESERNPKIQLNLNNHNISKFLKIDDNIPTKLYDFEQLDKLFALGDALQQDELSSACHFIRSKDIKDVTRGKYRLDYFRLYLDSILEKARKGEQHFAKRSVKSKLSLSKTQMISELSQYAMTPKCLEGFLVNYKAAVTA